MKHFAALLVLRYEHCYIILTERAGNLQLASRCRRHQEQNPGHKRAKAREPHAILRTHNRFSLQGVRPGSFEHYCFLMSRMAAVPTSA